MELTLDGDNEVQCFGDVSIELPSWMTCLSAKEIATSRCVGTTLIVAAGREPQSGDIVFMLGNHELRCLSVDTLKCINDTLYRERVPSRGHVAPCDGGNMIAIGTFKISREWACDFSRTLIGLRMTDETDSQTSPATNPGVRGR